MLTYTAIASLDGYINDEAGEFAWSAPDEEVHAFVNDLERPVGTYLLGRRLYEVMRVWETMDTTGEPEVLADYADIWRAADKVVYSTTLDAATTARTRVERAFDPGAIAALKAEGEVSVGGAHLAAQALRAGLVDEIRLFLSPIVVGGGTRALPDGARLDLALHDERRFANGVVFLRYAAAGA